MSHWDWKESEVANLLGTTLTRCVQPDGETLEFEVDDGRIFRMYHRQDCCESVYIESVNGDLSDLVGSPIVLADEAFGEAPEGFFEAEGYTPESQTWTFYRFATVKGFVDIRWFGSSNGYYSESVNFSLVNP